MRGQKALAFCAIRKNMEVFPYGLHMIFAAASTGAQREIGYAAKATVVHLLIMRLPCSAVVRLCCG